MKRVNAVFVSALVGFALLDAGSAAAQSARAQSRTQVIVASFNKSKHKVKEKYGVRMEKYKVVRSEPVVKANVRDYSGSYKVQGMGYALELRVLGDRVISAAGFEPVSENAPRLRTFVLQNTRIDGALLTATKVYANGATEPFDGVFINRTSFDSPKDRGTTTFGLGVIPQSVIVTSGLHLDKLFYERQR